MGFCRVKLLTLVNLNAPIVYTQDVSLPPWTFRHLSQSLQLAILQELCRPVAKRPGR